MNNPATCDESAGELAATGKSSSSDQSSATPQSSSSNESSRAPSGGQGTTSQGGGAKYKEKRRPEPLDLSIKSAGILSANSQAFTYDQLVATKSPNGRGHPPTASSAPHNCAVDISYYRSRATLMNSSSTNSASVLQTPRFIWADISEAMIKTRPLSSSSSSFGLGGNGGNGNGNGNGNGGSGISGHCGPRALFGAPFGSSLAGDSPPLTPNTPNSSYLLNMMSPSLMQSSPLSYQLLQQQHQLKSSLMGLSPRLAEASGFFMATSQSQQQQASSEKGTRRSSSSDNLNSLLQQASKQQQSSPTSAGESKKSAAISPLATKNLSSKSPSFQNLAAVAAQASNQMRNQSLLINVTPSESQSSSGGEQPQRSPNSNSNSSVASAPPITPTSLSSTTVDLLKIKLSSPQPPNRKSRATSGTRSGSTVEEPASSNNLQALITLGELFKPTSCQLSPKMQTTASKQLTPTSPINAAAYMSIGHASHSSSGTLDTPTLVSSAQLRAGSGASASMCFLPSPGFSPISAFEFERPSLCGSLGAVPGGLTPLAPRPSVDSDSSLSAAVGGCEPGALRADSDGPLTGFSSTLAAQPPPGQTNKTLAVSEGDLLQLVTSARDKVGARLIDDAPTDDNSNANINNNNNSNDEELGMEIDQLPGPTTIPRIQMPLEVGQPPSPHNQQRQQQQQPLTLGDWNAGSSAQTATNQALQKLSPSSSFHRLDSGHLSRARPRLKEPGGSGTFQHQGNQMLLSSHLGIDHMGPPGALNEDGQPACPQMCLSEAGSRWPSSSGLHAYNRSSSAEPALLSGGGGSHSDHQHLYPASGGMSRSAQYLVAPMMHQTAPLAPTPFDQQQQDHNHHQFGSALGSASAQELNRLAIGHQFHTAAATVAAAAAARHAQPAEQAHFSAAAASSSQYSSSSVIKDNMLNQLAPTMPSQPMIGLGLGPPPAPLLGTPHYGGIILDPAHGHLGKPAATNQNLDHHHVPATMVASQQHPSAGANQPLGRPAEFGMCGGGGGGGVPVELQTRPVSADPRAYLSRSATPETARAHSATGGATSVAPNTATAAKKYRCERCSRTFTRSDMLTRHKRLHSGDRPFKCDGCKQEFSRSDHLSTHMRTHTGEKPYMCKECPYAACRKDMITRHMKVHSRGSPSSANF